MAAVRVTASMIDGTSYEATGIYASLGDRIAFERKFASALMGLAKDDALTEEQVAFLVHRMLLRAGAAVGDFAVFTDGVADISIEVVPDPTAPAPQPTT